LKTNLSGTTKCIANMYLRENLSTNGNMNVVIFAIFLAMIIVIAFFESKAPTSQNGVLPTVYTVGRSSSVNFNQPPSKRMRVSISSDV